MEENRTPAPAARGDQLHIGSPDAILAVIPCLLGFHPSRSIVVVGAAPPRGRLKLAFRYDLPDPPDAGTAAKIASHAAGILSRQRLSVAIVAGYGPGPLVTPVADALVGELRRAGIQLHDMLRVHDGRYWSYSCRNPRCCPPEGVVFDPASHPAAAAMAAAGNKAMRDRAALAATIAPLRGLAEESMRQAVRRAERRAAWLLPAGRSPACGGAMARRVLGEGLRAVAEAIDVYREGGEVTSDEQIAWLAVALSDLRIRDDAWARMDPEQHEAHLRLWTNVVRRAPARYVPAPASLLAFAAWQAGNGALANVALERALAADPGYTMALLLLDAVGSGIPPSAARLPMTPEQVAASYEQSGRPDRTGQTARPGEIAKAGRAGEATQGAEIGQALEAGQTREAGQTGETAQTAQAGWPEEADRTGEVAETGQGERAEQGTRRRGSPSRSPRSSGPARPSAGPHRPAGEAPGPSGRSRSRARSAGQPGETRARSRPPR